MLTLACCALRCHHLGYVGCMTGRWSARPARRKLHKLTPCSDSLDILPAQESKVFYLDLKRNQRGEYLKIAEKGTNRERSTIIIPAVGLFVAKYANLSICAPCETRFLARFTQHACA